MEIHPAVYSIKEAVGDKEIGDAVVNSNSVDEVVEAAVDDMGAVRTAGGASRKENTTAAGFGRINALCVDISDDEVADVNAIKKVLRVANAEVSFNFVIPDHVGEVGMGET